MGGLGGIFVPPHCLVCFRATGSSGMLCGACWANMRFIEHPRCRILGAPLAYDSGFETTSLTALADPPVFDRLRSVAVFNDISGALVRRLKFGDEPELARKQTRQ